jgi:hypothetical protein
MELLDDAIAAKAIRDREVWLVCVVLSLPLLAVASWCEKTAAGFCGQSVSF